MSDHHEKPRLSHSRGRVTGRMKVATASAVRDGVPRESVVTDRDRIRVLCLASDDAQLARVHELLEPCEVPTYLIGKVADEDDFVRRIEEGVWDVALVFLDDFEESVGWPIGGVPMVAVGRANDSDRRGETRRRLRAAGFCEFVPEPALGAVILENAIHHAIELSAMQQSLDDLLERFALAVHGANDGLWEWNIATGTTFYSRRWKELLGYENAAIAGTIEEWFSRVHPADAQRLRHDIDAHLDGRKSFHETEHRIRAADGSYRWVLSRGVAQRDGDGRPQRMAGSLTDVSDYREREATLRQQSRQDAVTELPRRELFMERLARAVELARQHDDYDFAVLLVEVDRLRMLNESIGHAAGDAVLAQLARRLEASIDDDALIARFGGAKFSILLENVDDPSQGTEVANHIHDSVKEPFEIDGQPVYVTVSIGMTSSARDYTRAEDVVSDMIAAATRAKHRVQDRYEMFSTHMRVEALTLMRLEMGLRQAVERGEFQLYYQPIVSLRDGYLEGFEALVRWSHPRRGMVSPAEFIPVAENTGMIVPIGRWAIGEAVKQLKAWHEEFEVENELSVSVNLSGKQVSDPKLLSSMRQMLEETRLKPGTLKVELTESVLMENADLVTDLLHELRRLGIQIWVDDFGTGYSSLSYLHRFPVDGLKIDKSFVDVLDGSPDSATMVRTIVDLARNLGVMVVAEGIERKVQADQLRGLGCPAGQGYFFGRPGSRGDAYALIASGRS